ncbi:MAG: hypothetical protein R6W06_01310 [Prochlorococcaceae cyanobacterium]
MLSSDPRRQALIESLRRRYQEAQNLSRAESRQALSQQDLSEQAVTKQALFKEAVYLGIKLEEFTAIS